MLDVRRRPDHRAELGTQLLLGERVTVLASRAGGGWLKVRNAVDGYEGWVRSWGLQRGSRAAAGRWQQRARAEVGALWTEATTRPGGGDPLSPLVWGTRLVPLGRSGRTVRVQLPDGRAGWVPAAALRTAGRAVPSLRERIRSLMGIPYLWGGRTPAGLDCSGFTQLVLGEQGRVLPRDSRHQLRACRRLERGENPETGDLVFFGRPGEPVSHVGIWLDPGTFVHCRGTVKLGSFDPLNPLCERDLLAQLRAIRRPPAMPG